MKVLVAMNHTQKVNGHIHMEKANTTEDVLVLKQEKFKTIEPKIH